MNQGAYQEAAADETWADDAPAAPARVTITRIAPDAPAARGKSAGAAALLALIALGWIGGLVYALIAAGAPAALTPLRLAAWIGLGSGPLALVALLYLLLLRTGRAEARAYSRAAARLRADSESLAAAMTLLTGRIEQSRLALDAQAGQLQSLGVEAGTRMRLAAAELGDQAKTFGRAAASFDDATARARADLGVLLSDLPEAETRAGALAERLRACGGEADTRTRTLGDLMVELEARGRAASEATGGAAARLAGQLERIEAGAAAADRRIEDAAGAMGRAVETALGAAAEGVEDTRRAAASQSAALTAMVEQGRTTIGAAGDEAQRALAARIDELAARIEGIGESLSSREQDTRALLARLGEAIGAIEARFASLGETGGETAADLSHAVGALANHTDAVGRALGGSAQSADTLLGRVVQLREQAEASSVAIRETIPAALSRVRLHAEQSLQSITGASQRAEGLSGAVGAVAERLGEADALIERQRAALDETHGRAGQRLDALREQAQALETLLAKAEAEVRALADGASGPLIEALLRVREVAAQASDQARDALSAAIPRAAQRLSESATRAMTAAIADVGQAEMAAVGTAAAQAVEAARGAAERLTRHLLTIAETSTAIEARIAENREDTEAHDEASFARAVSLLIEALNSTAIDVTRLFAHEIGEEQWKAYLRGDRGIFTRHAVRLLDRAEAGAIAARYGEDGDFRELVNRYVHDFEALLRRMMSTRDGHVIATTMLSSDAGKLYVALAQGIERLRR